jgi:hypothetical protein
MVYGAKLFDGLGLSANEWKEIAAEWQERAEKAEAALAAELQRNGGAAATYFNGKLVICHPDMPVHIWDGAKMERVEPPPAG